MICTILSCPNGVQRNRKPPDLNFFAFPADMESFNAWVAATGREDFIPNLSSKVCSKHFTANSFLESGKLKKNAIPTLHLREEPKLKEEPKGRKHQTSTDNTVACILNSNVALNTVDLVHRTADGLQACSTPRTVVVTQTTHKVVNIVSSANDLFQSCLPEDANTIVLNYSRNMMTGLMPGERNLLPRLVNVGDMQVVSESMSTSVTLNSTDIPKKPMIFPQGISNSEPKPALCPIKLVDVNKLLEKPPVESVDTSRVMQNTQKKLEGRRRKAQPSFRPSNTPSPKINDTHFDSNKIRNIFQEASPLTGTVTVSHVFDCLRVILPRSFLLSRLKPSEKVAALVIKYLKLDNNKSVENLIKVNLTIIIDAAKLEDKEFGDYVSHPYHKISDVPLKVALDRVFPKNFSNPDVTDEKLKCLCVVLSQDIFIDGYSILRRKISKFTRKGYKSNAVNQETKEGSSTPSDKLRIGIQIVDNKTPNIASKRQKMANDYIGNNDVEVQIVDSKTQSITSKRHVFHKTPNIVSKIQKIADIENNSVEVKIGDNKTPNISSKRQQMSEDCIGINSVGVHIVDNKTPNIASKRQNVANDYIEKDSVDLQIVDNKTPDIAIKKIYNKTPNTASKLHQKPEDCIEKNSVGVDIVNNKTPKIYSKGQNMAENYLREKNVEKIIKEKKVFEHTSKTVEGNVTYNQVKNIGENKGDDCYKGSMDNSDINSDDKKAKLATNLKLIVSFLAWKKCSAQSVLDSSNAKINLCKFLRIGNRMSNIERLDKMLNFIIQKNITKNNIDTIGDTIDKTVRIKDIPEKKVTQQVQNLSGRQENETKVITQSSEFKQQDCSFTKQRNIDKLNLRPVVVLNNVVDFGRDQLLFMGEKPRPKRNRHHNLRVPQCFAQSNPIPKYSSDQVRKLTKESFSEFRRIVMKKDGEKVVFRLHYKSLNPGTPVFVKDFRYLTNGGWLKGTITKMIGPLKYIVELDDGKTRSCVIDQIRPLPDTEHRVQRQIKPRQLFDL